MAISKRFRIASIAAVAVAVVFALTLAVKGPAIFQRGNPVPYIVAAMQVNDESPFAYVGEEDGRSVYIMERDACEELIAHIESESGFSYLEQAGAGFIFEDGEERLIAQSEVYWGRWSVWEVPLQL